MMPQSKPNQSFIRQINYPKSDSARSRQCFRLELSVSCIKTLLKLTVQHYLTFTT